MTAAQIRADYQPNLDYLAKQKKELLAQRVELIEAQNILLKHGLPDVDVYYKIREIEESVNSIIDTELEIKKEINRQINYLIKLGRQQKEEQAFWDGQDAYTESVSNGTLVARCPYATKYLQKAWKKGYDYMVSIEGSLGGGIEYAA